MHTGLRGEGSLLVIGITQFAVAVADTPLPLLADNDVPEIQSGHVLMQSEEMSTYVILAVRQNSRTSAWWWVSECSQHDSSNT